MSIDVALLRDALRAQPVDDEQGPNDLAVEKMGGDAFDWLVGALKENALTVNEAVRALRLLSRLSRQFCLERKGDLLDLTADLAESPSVHINVRSTGAHIAMVNVRLARMLGEASGVYGRPLNDVRQRVLDAVRRALELGLTPETEAAAQEFLAATSDIP